MSEADIKINSKVRKIVVETNLDTSALRISTTSGVVSVKGEFNKFPGIKISDREIARLLVVLEENILRTKGVKRVNFSLDSWKKKKGKWTKQDE